METLQRTANRGSISTGFDIDNSLKLEEDNTEYLHFTPSSQTDYERMTFSIWIKRTELTGSGNPTRLVEFGNGTANTTQLRILFDTSDRLGIYGNSIVWRESTQTFKDTSAWYHLFFKFDTTQGTSNDRIRVWVNGNMIAHTDYNTVNNPGSGTAMGFNRTNAQTIGQQQEGGVIANNGFNGYIAQAWGSGGTPPDVTDFGEFDSDSGIWKPKDISEVSIPDSNGFFLDFSDSSDLGNDSSSNNNDFTLNNITSADQATDTPTNNFATINILHAQTSNSTYTEGATYAVNGQIQGWQPYIPTIAVTSGKWYFETQGGGSDMYLMTGMGDEGDLLEWGIDQKYYGRSGSKSVAYYGGTGGNGLIYPAQTNPSPAVQYGSSDIIGCAVDIDNGYVYWHKNGTYINGGVPTSGATGTGGTAIPTGGNSNGTYYLGAATYANSNMKFNYGGYTTISISSGASDSNNYGVFEYAPPTGYYALCTKNLAEYG